LDSEQALPVFQLYNKSFILNDFDILIRRLLLQKFAILENRFIIISRNCEDKCENMAKTINEIEVKQQNNKTNTIESGTKKKKNSLSLQVGGKIALTNSTSSIGIINNDALLGLKSLPSNTFHVAVTSPPYFWARDYGIEGQIGHEDTVEEFVASLVAVFDEVKRVLHPEGVFYLNIGDTYYSGNGQPHGTDPRSPSRNFMRKKMRAVDKSGWDIPKKSLIGIPWKVAFAMQEKGWTLRSDIIWNRCNAFSEPTARDRPFRQHEHVFLFSKSRFYSFDRSQLEEEDVWNIPIERTKRIDHNAAFPAELVRRCILTGSPVGGFVLDPFLGSGTTLDVALELGRHGVGIDLSSKYINELLVHMNKIGCVESGWDSLACILSKEPLAWKTWAGNLNNFRKPGTKIKPITP
jgi:DNA modification methylase